MPPSPTFREIEREFKFPFTPTQQQAALLLAHFVDSHITKAACILRGFAGTGKTSLVGALVKALRIQGRDVVLMAPTGRAAKVFARFAETPAHTIHKVVYRQNSFNGERTSFSLGFNSHKNTLFIVDEASMIAVGKKHVQDTIFGSGELLDDLISFVYSSPGCKMLLVGDPGQLPPVGENESPALNDEVIKEYGLTVGSADLTEVVRQANLSNVLIEATKLRQLMAEKFQGFPTIQTTSHGEVRDIPGNELIETLIDDYRTFGEDEVILITRSNKQANRYNFGIRARIFDREEILTRGDRIMAVKNNYFWTEKAAKILTPGQNLPMDFIANGDVAEVVRLRNLHTIYNFQFADATLRFTDYEDFEIDCRVMLTTLTSDSPSLTKEESTKFYEAILEDYIHIPTKKERLKALRQDPYYNALQIKYAYALTCHKAQGGQWARVYIDQGFVPEEEAGVSYLRWLYTAFTRTKDCVGLLNRYTA